MTSLQAIENNGENHTTLIRIYNIITELHNQRKKLTLYKVPAHIRIKGNEEADKAAKQAMDMPGINTTRLGKLNIKQCFPMYFGP